MRSTAIGRPSSTVKERNRSKSESEIDQSQRKVRPQKIRQQEDPTRGEECCETPKEYSSEGSGAQGTGSQRSNPEGHSAFWKQTGTENRQRRPRP